MAEDTVVTEPDQSADRGLTSESPTEPVASTTAVDIDRGNFRGPLRYEIETSSTILEAGRMFSVFLRITNPYDVPVTILGVETQLPIELLEPYGKRNVSGMWQKFKQVFSREYDAALQKSMQKMSANSLSIEQNNTNENGVERDASENASVNVLQPGNSLLKEFTVRTRQSNLFTPSVCYFHMQITYEMEGKVNHDTAKTSLNIKAPISAMGLGAIVGAIIGTFLRRLDGGKPFAWDLPLFVSCLSSVLISLVLVIVFARKKDAQPFITIEDFYGGTFVGVLAGYGGYSLLHQMLNIGNGAADIANQTTGALTK
jgi:F0F1-type ATP synthase assembly protein I